MEVVAAIVAVAGTLLGLVVGHGLKSREDRRRLQAEDDRRWLAERKVLYASFVQEVRTLVREIDWLALQLPYDPANPGDSDLEVIEAELPGYYGRLDEQAQEALANVLLVSDDRVADVAQRIVDALVDTADPVERRGFFTEYYPRQLALEDLINVLQNAMRAELGISTLIRTDRHTDPHWPWLADRPPVASYRQGHGLLDALPQEESGGEVP